MHIGEIITGAVIFLAMYAQIFLLLAFLEKRKELGKNKVLPDLPKVAPLVAVVIPCWNEETTVHRTIESLLALDYPKDKLEIIAVDDGSTDTTWKELQKYATHPQVRLFQKPNGGKHTAVNFGIERTSADIIGCIDADSFVAPDALRRMIALFYEKPDVMAVCPSIIVDSPKRFIQHVQQAEYNLSLYIKKSLSFVDGIHVVPGPFSFFRKEVFQKVGMFREAHNTEDAEMAFRMQTNHLKIDHCHRAHVYTVGPDSIKKLIRQRQRWIYGFLQNAKDYRKFLFKQKYGVFSLFTVPMGVISIGTIIYIFFSILYTLGKFIAEKVVQIQTVGWRLSFHGFHFDPFFINTATIAFVSVLLYAFLITAIIYGHRIAGKRIRLQYVFFYIALYTIIEPIWLMKAAWGTIHNRKPSWR